MVPTRATAGAGLLSTFSLLLPKETWNTGGIGAAREVSRLTRDKDATLLLPVFSCSNPDAKLQFQAGKQAGLDRIRVLLNQIKVEVDPNSGQS